MAFTDEQLMAYADGELGDAERAALETALHTDPSLAARVAAHRALRSQVAAAFEDDLQEPVPERLQQLLRPSTTKPAPTATDLRRGRGAEAANTAFWGWMRWGGLAASLSLGLVLGHQFWPRSDSWYTERDGRLVATGGLADALNTQLSGAAPNSSALTLRLSFMAQDGHYCRAFQAADQAGLACREGGDWRVQTLLRNAAPAAGELRQAASSLPQALLSEIDQRIAGNPLNAAAERQARSQGWQR